MPISAHGGQVKTVVRYGPLAENAAESLRGGIEVVVIGRFVDDSYDQDGHLQRRILQAGLICTAADHF